MNIGNHEYAGIYLKTLLCILGDTVIHFVYKSEMYR